MFGVRGDSDMTRVVLPILIVLGTVRLAPAEQPTGERPAIDFEPLDCRWTFGNHEPISMYRRLGRRSTGGIEGGARWLEKWHHWFDSERCTQTMQELGLNMLHSRFYKGMGWQYESRDFPNVKRFVKNCHKHGIRALAYVQFSTLYYETMLAEIPDLEDWVAVDRDGHKRTYHGDSYFRWLPCINHPGFEPYLKKVMRIALEEGGFDGIMFDNCFWPPCYCQRCTELFREHLRTVPDPERRFGIPTVDHVLPPRLSGYGEAKDPIYQEWLQFRCERMTALFRRLYEHGKSCKASALITGNVANIRRSNMAASTGLSVTDLAGCFDIFVSQSGNEPGLRDGYIINRIREMKLAGALGTDILALSDSDAGITREAESKYVLNLMENAVFGGIPTDRTILKPDKDEMVSHELIAFRAPVLRRFNETVKSGRASFKMPTYMPVQLLYSAESVMFSEQAFRSLLSAEEILLRNHVPYGLLPTDRRRPLTVPKDCEVLLVCDQPCLSDSQLASLIQFAEKGGCLLVTGRTGAFDERYGERAGNPLIRLGAGPNVVCRGETDQVRVASGGWTIKVAAPKDGGRRLMADLLSLWKPAVRVEAPPTVLAEIKRKNDAFAIHLLNYSAKPVSQGVRIQLSAEIAAPKACSFGAPMEKRQAKSLPLIPAAPGWHVELPQFTDYAVVNVRASSAP